MNLQRMILFSAMELIRVGILSLEILKTTYLVENQNKFGCVLYKCRYKEIILGVLILGSNSYCGIILLVETYNVSQSFVCLLNFNLIKSEDFL